MIYLPGFVCLNVHKSRIVNILDLKVNDLMKKMVYILIDKLEWAECNPWQLLKRMDFKFDGNLHTAWIYALANS